MPDNEDCSADFPCVSPSRNYHTKDTFPLDWEVDPETVGQFIGLADKNGKKIFEGDIVRDNYDTNLRLLSDSKEKPRSGIAVVKFGIHMVPADDPFELADAYGFYLEGETLYPSPACYKRVKVGKIESFLGRDCRDIEVIGNIHENPELLEEE